MPHHPIATRTQGWCGPPLVCRWWVDSGIRTHQQRGGSRRIAFRQSADYQAVLDATPAAPAASPKQHNRPVRDRIDVWS
jgi:hypothetical protein